MSIFFDKCGWATFPEQGNKASQLQKKRTRNEGKIIHQPTNTPVIHRNTLFWWSNFLTYADLRSTLPASGRDDFQSILISHGFRSQLSSLMVEEVKGMREGRSLLNSCQLLLKAPPPAPQPPPPRKPRATRRCFSIKGRTKKKHHFPSGNNTLPLYCQRILASVEVNSAASQPGGSGHVLRMPSLAPTLLNSRPPAEPTERDPAAFSRLCFLSPSSRVLKSRQHQPRQRH